MVTGMSISLRKRWEHQLVGICILDIAPHLDNGEVARLAESMLINGSDSERTNTRWQQVAEQLVGLGVMTEAQVLMRLVDHRLRHCVDDPQISDLVEPVTVALLADGPVSFAAVWNGDRDHRLRELGEQHVGHPLTERVWLADPSHIQPLRTSDAMQEKFPGLWEQLEPAAHRVAEQWGLNLDDDCLFTELRAYEPGGYWEAIWQPLLPDGPDGVTFDIKYIRVRCRGTLQAPDGVRDALMVG